MQIRFTDGHLVQIQDGDLNTKLPTQSDRAISMSRYSCITITDHPFCDAIEYDGKHSDIRATRAPTRMTADLIQEVTKRKKNRTWRLGSSIRSKENICLLLYTSGISVAL